MIRITPANFSFILAWIILILSFIFSKVIFAGMSFVLMTIGIIFEWMRIEEEKRE